MVLKKVFNYFLKFGIGLSRIIAPIYSGICKTWILLVASSVFIKRRRRLCLEVAKAEIGGTHLWAIWECAPGKYLARSFSKYFFYIGEVVRAKFRFPDVDSDPLLQLKWTQRPGCTNDPEQNFFGSADVLMRLIFDYFHDFSVSVTQSGGKIA